MLKGSQSKSNEIQIETKKNPKIHLLKACTTTYNTTLYENGVFSSQKVKRMIIITMVTKVR